MKTKTLLLLTAALTVGMYAVVPNISQTHKIDVQAQRPNMVQDHPLTRCAQRDGSRLVVRETQRHGYGEGLCNSPF